MSASPAKKAMAKKNPNVIPIETARLKRMSFQVSESLFNEINTLATSEGDSMTEVFKKAMKWYAFVHEVKTQGERIFIGNSPNEVTREIVPI